MRGLNPHWLLIAPILGFLALVPVFYFSDLDLTIQDRYYDRDTGLWSNAYRQPWTLLNLHGELPGTLLGLASFSIILLSVGRAPLHKLRKGAAFALSTLLLGPGLLVNSVFKEHWGRPRPLLVDIWDGENRFEPFLHFDPATDGNSFPSGHASMGFYLVVVAMLFLATGRRQTALWLTFLTLALGTIIGTSRVVSGKHFPSDVLFAGLLTWSTAVTLYYLLGMHRSPLPQTTPAPSENLSSRLFRRSSPFLVAVLFCYPLVRWNYQTVSTTTFDSPVTPEESGLEIRLEDSSHLRVRRGDRFQFHCFTSGRGLIGSKAVTTPHLEGEHLTFEQTRSGFPTKISPIITVLLPPGLPCTIYLDHPGATCDTRAIDPSTDTTVKVIPSEQHAD